MTTAPDTLQEETRILLLVRREQDRELLADHFSSDHEVLLGRPGQEWPAFDVCLVDSAWYGEVADDLRERRTAAEPVYLPVLLLVQGEVGEALSAADDALFDDVLGLPASRKELGARVDSALRARELSLDLEERRDELALYRHAMDEADIGITIADASEDLPLVYVNDGFCEVTGYDREEAIGRNCRFLQGPDTEEEPVAEMRRAIEAGESTTVELRNYRADGECFWNEVSIAPIEDEAGNVTHYIGFQRDVTGRKERGRELEETRLRLQLAVEGSELSVWEVDYEAGVTTFETGEEKHFGIEVDSLDVEEFYELVHPEDHERVREAFERGRDEGSVKVEYRIRRPDTGEVRWIEDIGEFEYEDGDVVRCVGTGRDITEQKRRELALEQLQRRTQSLMHTATREETARVAVETAHDVLDAPLNGVHLLSEDGERLEPAAFLDTVRAELDEPPIYHRTEDDPASAVVWEAFEGDDPLVIDDTREYGDLAEVTPARSVVIHPLGEHGVFITSSTDPDWFGELETALLDILATALTTALDRAAREQQLRETSHRLALAVETTGIRVWELDATTDVVTVQQRDDRSLLGIGANNLDLEAFYGYVHEDDRERLREAVDAAVAGRERLHEEVRARNVETGEWRWLELLAERREDTDRPVLLGTTRDVTERKEHVQELERYEAIVEAAPDPIVAYDTEGRITLANEELAEAFDVPYEQLVGTHASEVFDREAVERSNDLIRTMLSEGLDQGTMEVEYGNPPRLFEASMAPLRDEDGEYRGTVGVARDVTELREHEQRLSVLDRVLRHNLRNKMNVVLGHARDLLDADDPAVRDAARVITDAGEELLGLSESARRFHETMESTDRTDLDIAERIRDVVDELRLENPDASFALDLPASACARVSDGVELALNEVLENAVVHCDRDPAVEVTVTTEADEVVVRVADNGPGIQPQERRALELDTERPLEHASGLGLWLVRWTVDASGGSVTIEEREPRGTVVELRFDAASTE